VRLRAVLCALALGLALALPAHAVMPDEVLADPALEQRARGLSQELRCLVCQNQSIDDSNAPLARDLRVLVRERLVAGDSDEAVLDFVVARYGEYVLLRPPFGPETWALWIGPFAVFAVAGAGVAVWLRARRRGRDEPAPLTAEEMARIERLMQEERG
jgi:cytochrome c-type biogenesis protein CcmH